jgi:hypothetical protein
MASGVGIFTRESSLDSVAVLAKRAESHRLLVSASPAVIEQRAGGDVSTKGLETRREPPGDDETSPEARVHVVFSAAELVPLVVGPRARTGSLLLEP